MGKRKISFNDFILRRKFLAIKTDKDEIIIRVYTAYFEVRLSSKQYRIFKSFGIYNYCLISNFSGYDLVITADDFRRIDRKIIRL